MTLSSSFTEVDVGRRGEAVDASAAMPLTLSVTETRDADSVTLTLRVNGRSVFFRITGVDVPPLENCDFAVVATIFMAMRLRRPLHVAGKVTRKLLAHLEEFQDAWHTWLPKQYVPVPIVADEEVVEPEVRQDRAAIAFSGGLDSAYAMLLNARAAYGRRSVPPAAGVLIHGLDIAVSDEAAFAVAENNAREMLATLGVPLASVATNWRSELCHNWRMEHMAGIAAALHLFHGIAGVAIVGSDEGYDELDIPWGSNYVTNPLLGGGAMALRTDGGDRTRTERLAFVAGQSDLAGKLRVCWENSHGGGNCGRCEKCVSTQLNYLAAGLEPEGFERRASFLDIALSPIRSKGDLYFLLESQRAASRRGIAGAWRVAASVAIARHALARPVLILLDEIKAWVRRNQPLYEYLRNLRVSR